MRLKALAIGLAAALTSLAGPSVARATGNDVVIGDIDDLSGLYADIVGPAAVEAVKMAIADFGGTVLGRKIVTLVADHQNKPDIGASKLDRKSTRLNSSHVEISYAVFCLKKNN